LTQRHYVHGHWHYAHGHWNYAHGHWHYAHGHWHYAHGHWHHAYGQTGITFTDTAPFTDDQRLQFLKRTRDLILAGKATSAASLSACVTHS